jgi:hypothetical protein
MDEHTKLSFDMACLKLIEVAVRIVIVIIKLDDLYVHEMNRYSMDKISSSILYYNSYRYRPNQTTTYSMILQVKSAPTAIVLQRPERDRKIGDHFRLHRWVSAIQIGKYCNFQPKQMK